MNQGFCAVEANLGIRMLSLRIVVGVKNVYPRVFCRLIVTIPGHWFAFLEVGLGHVRLSSVQVLLHLTKTKRRIIYIVGMQMIHAGPKAVPGILLLSFFVKKVLLVKNLNFDSVSDVGIC